MLDQMLYRPIPNRPKANDFGRLPLFGGYWL